MIGLSLSLCVSEIARGLVPEDQVEKIIASTYVTSAEEFEQLVEQYCTVYWRDLPEAPNIARRFFAAGKIEQPRLLGLPAHNISRGHWRK